MNVAEQYLTKARERFLQNNYPTAKQLFEQALAALLSDRQADPQLIAETLNNLGFTCMSMNSLAEAQQYFEQAVAKYRENSVAFSPDYAIALHNLGRLMHRLGDNKLAWDYLTQELQLWKQTREPGHVPYVATCLYSLGEIMADDGEYNGARRNFEQALQLRENIFGPQHEDVAEILADLGFLCNAMGDTTSALSYLKRALPLLEVALPANHPEIIRVKELIAQLEPPKKSGLFGRFGKN